MPRRLSVFISFFLLGFLSYVSSFYRGFLFDDYAVIVNNPVLHQLGSLKSIFQYDPTRFLTHLTFAINYHFSELNSFSYHLVNLIIHVINTVLLYRLLTLIIGKQKQLLVLTASFIFLLHPLQTQAVIYIAQRSTLLATAFYLLSFILYIHVRQRFNTVSYIMLWGSVILGCVTKPIFITLPITLILYEWIFGQQKEKNRFRIIPFVPTILPVVVIPYFLYLFNLKFAQETGVSGLTLATSVNSEILRAHYLFTQFPVVVTYLKLLFFPISQNVDYDFMISKTLFEPTTLLCALLIILLIGVGVFFRRKNELVAFSILWFFVLLIPESSIFPLSDVIFEHRLYLAVGSFALFLVVLLEEVIKNQFRYIIASLLILSVLTTFTVIRGVFWGEPELLLIDTIQKSPLKARPVHQLGIYYEKQEKLVPAESSYLLAIKKDKKYFPAYLSLGNFYAKQKKYESAKHMYKRILMFSPNHFEGNLNLGIIYAFSGKGQEATTQFLKTIEINRDDSRSYYHIGRIYGLIKRYGKAEEFLKQAIVLNPLRHKYHYELGNLYLDLGRYKEAIDSYNKVIHLNKRYGDAYNTLGIAYTHLGQNDQARTNFEFALKFKSDNIPVYLNLAQFYQNMGDKKTSNYYLNLANTAAKKKHGN